MGLKRWFRKKPPDEEPSSAPAVPAARGSSLDDATMMDPRRVPVPEGGVPFGHYSLLGLLGAGGMARVYVADESLEDGGTRRVALKRLADAVTVRALDRKSLVNEARLGGHLENPHIVRTLGWGDVDGHWYLAMELVEGWSMFQILSLCRREDRAVPTTVVGEVLQGILVALDYAHRATDGEGRELKLIHRDLKPGNIMVTRAGDVKVADFGIARAESNLHRTKTAEGIKGTPSYMSPDQLIANKQLDHRSDLWTLGALVVEIATLWKPFAATTAAEAIERILDGDLSEVLDRLAEVAPALVPVVARLLVRDRDQRYPSAADALVDLEIALHGLPSGPTLAGWLGEIGARLPAAPRLGDFGRAGPPEAVRAKGGVPMARGVPAEAVRRVAGADPEGD